MPRRILLLITDLETGGTPTVVRELAIRLRNPPEVEFEVACLSRWGPVADQLRDAGVRVTAFDARGARDLARVVRKLIRLIRDRSFDTVFSFLIHANTVAAIASRFCRDVRFIQSIQTTQPRPRWHWWLQTIVQGAGEKVVVPSYSAAKAARDWSSIQDDKIVIIANAVSECGMGEASKQHGRGAYATITIGFLGRLDPVKRIPDLVRAMPLLGRRCHLEIFGDGPQRVEIEALIARLSLADRVTLRGTIAKPQAALEGFDVLVLPSEAEGFGLVLIEAMAAGVPVVATDVPGIRDVVQHGVSGLLVPVARPDELSRAIQRVVSDRELRAWLIAKGLQTVRERYSWEVVLPQYRRLLQIEI